MTLDRVEIVHLACPPCRIVGDRDRIGGSSRIKKERESDLDLQKVEPNQCNLLTLKGFGSGESSSRGESASIGLRSARKAPSKATVSTRSMNPP